MTALQEFSMNQSAQQKEGKSQIGLKVLGRINLGLLLFVMFILPNTALAITSSGTGAQTIDGSGIIQGDSVTFVNNLLKFLQSDFVKVAGVVGIVVAGMLFVVGENQGWFKIALRVIFPLLIIANLGTILGALGAMLP